LANIAALGNLFRLKIKVEVAPKTIRKMFWIDAFWKISNNFCQNSNKLTIFAGIQLSKRVHRKANVVTRTGKNDVAIEWRKDRCVVKSESSKINAVKF
jgi:uncharacterized metal-binding protein